MWGVCAGEGVVVVERYTIYNTFENAILIRVYASH